jgi:hypothetical protein
MLSEITLTGYATWLPPLADPGAPIHFSWVRDDEILPTMRAVVDDMTRRSVDRLRMDPVRVRYFGPPLPDADITAPHPVGDQAILGFYVDLDTIAINACIRGDDILRVATAHEVRHVWQHRAGLKSSHSDADRFARVMLGR